MSGWLVATYFASTLTTTAGAASAAGSLDQPRFPGEEADLAARSNSSTRVRGELAPLLHPRRSVPHSALSGTDLFERLRHKHPHESSRRSTVSARSRRASDPRRPCSESTAPVEGGPPSSSRTAPRPLSASRGHVQGCSRRFSRSTSSSPAARFQRCMPATGGLTPAELQPSGRDCVATTPPTRSQRAPWPAWRG